MFFSYSDEGIDIAFHIATVSVADVGAKEKPSAPFLKGGRLITVHRYTVMLVVISQEATRFFAISGRRLAACPWGAGFAGPRGGRPAAVHFSGYPCSGDKHTPIEY